MLALNWRYYYAEELLCGNCAARYDWSRRILFSTIIIAGVVVYEWIKVRF